MKNWILVSLIFCIPVILIGQRLDGSFQLKEAQYGNDPMEKMIGMHAVKLFKDGYWLTSFFGKRGQQESESGGGTYRISNGKYIETLIYYSWDSTASGQTYTFDYSLNGDNYNQDGYINSEKYRNYLIRERSSRVTTLIPLKDRSLEGAWLLEGKADSKLDGIKLFVYPSFQCAYFDKKTKAFRGTYGGRYWYDGETLIEHVDFSSFEMATGMDNQIPLSVKGGTFTQPRIDSAKPETWKKTKK